MLVGCLVVSSHNPLLLQKSVFPKSPNLESSALALSYIHTHVPKAHVYSWQIKTRIYSVHYLTFHINTCFGNRSLSARLRFRLFRGAVYQRRRLSLIPSFLSIRGRHGGPRFLSLAAALEHMKGQGRGQKTPNKTKLYVGA